jgi:hypothetical protein
MLCVASHQLDWHFCALVGGFDFFVYNTDNNNNSDQVQLLLTSTV